jgi:hypothetical protein
MITCKIYLTFPRHTFGLCKWPHIPERSLSQSPLELPSFQFNFFGSSKAISQPAAFKPRQTPFPPLYPVKLRARTMRLLKRSDTGEFSLTECFMDDNEIPPYAILSHTWVAGEEVVFEELKNGTGKGKSGYDKIRFCGEQAKRDGLQYFWVDTCCIDKSSSAELTEAINSMFRWYRNAVKCYVYLSDVSKPGHGENDDLPRSTWKLAFRKSRWFTRGWTLQELLAPAVVEFFSLEGGRLGDKRSMEQHIHEITRIPIQALQGTPLSYFKIDERMSWAAHRHTKRPEDKAYSLFGIFDTQMPSNYGEGLDNAFRRLRRTIAEISHGKPLAQLLIIRQSRIKLC